jgi:hypothetical protein
LCTLRSRRRRRPRNTHYQAGATPYLGRTCTGRTAPAFLALKQYSPAVSALREKAILAGLRVERKESGDAGAFAHLTEAELDELILVEYARLKALPAPDSDKAEAREIARKRFLSTNA